MLGLEYFSFTVIWTPLYFLALVIVGILYWFVTGTMKTSTGELIAVSTKQKVLFYTALTLYYLAQAGPLKLLGHLHFSAHMTVMAISYLIVPPLMILGIPTELLRRFAMLSIVRRVFRYVGHPLIALLSFNLLFSLYHYPAIMDFSMTRIPMHIGFHIALFITSTMMWWTVIGPVPELSRMTDVKKMGFIFANGVLLTPACALIIFAGSPMYGAFNDPDMWVKAMGYCIPGNAAEVLKDISGPAQFQIMPPLEDQQLGGVLMKLVQEFVYGGVLAYTFARWFRRENKSRTIDPIPET